MYSFQEDVFSGAVRSKNNVKTCLVSVSTVLPSSHCFYWAYLWSPPYWHVRSDWSFFNLGKNLGCFSSTTVLSTILSRATNVWSRPVESIETSHSKVLFIFTNSAVAVVDMIAWSSGAVFTSHQSGCMCDSNYFEDTKTRIRNNVLYYLQHWNGCDTEKWQSGDHMTSMASGDHMTSMPGVAGHVDPILASVEAAVHATQSWTWINTDQHTREWPQSAYICHLPHTTCFYML